MIPDADMNDTLDLLDRCRRQVRAPVLADNVIGI
jgi:hypothetical protein